MSRLIDLQKEKIAVVCPYTPSIFGGVAQQAIITCQTLTKLGIPNLLITPKPKKRNLPRMEGIKKLQIYPTSKIIFSGSTSSVWWLPPAALITPYLLKNKVSLIHLHQPTVPFSSNLLLAARKLGIPILGHLHANLKKLSLAKFKFFADAAIGDSLEFVDLVAACSPTATYLFQRYWPKKIPLIPNMIDTERFNPAKYLPKKQYSDGKRNLLFIGRHDPRKGILTLIEIFKRLNKEREGLRLIIIGSGPLMDKAKLLASGDVIKQRKNIVWIGNVRDQELPSYLKTAHLLIAPSTGWESWGLILFEALAMRIPPVCSDIDGYRLSMRETLPKYADLLLAKKEVPSSFVKKILYLLAHDHLREEIGDLGRKNVEKKYAPGKIVSKKIIPLYQELLEKKGCLPTKNPRL